MRVLGLIFLQVAAIGCSHSGPKTWHRFETKHVILKANVSKERGEQLIRDVERFRAALGALTSLDFSEDPTPKLRVFAFSDSDDYKAASGLPDTAGVYINLVDGNSSLVSLEEGDKIWEKNLGRQVLLHEYTHHLLHQYSPFMYPRWYDEGFAEYVSTIEFDGTRATLGKPVIHRLLTLKDKNGWLDLRELLESKGQYIGYMGNGSGWDPDRYRVGVMHQYAQGWLTVHFLHHTKRYAERLPKYLEAIDASNVKDEAAFKRAFGVDYRKMQGEISSYWYGRNLPYSVVDLSGVLPDIQVAHRPMSPVESSVAAMEAKSQLGRLKGSDADEAIRRLKMVRDERTDPAARARTAKLMATIALRNKAWEQAEALIDELDADNESAAVAYALRAHLLMSRNDGKITGNSTQQIIELCDKALALDPNYVPAVHCRIAGALRSKDDVTPSTLALVERLRILAPGVSTVGRMEVSVLSRLGRYDLALRKAQRLIEWATSRDEARALEKLRDKVLSARDRTN